MNRLILALAAFGLVSVGSAVLAQAPPSDDRPLVSLSGTSISVDPQALRFARGKGAVVIQWRLPGDARYRFASNGIVIDGEVNPAAATDPSKGGPPRLQNEVVQCQRTGNGMSFTCQNRNSRAGTYKYTIRLVDEKGTALPPLDPVIVNME